MQSPGKNRVEKSGSASDLVVFRDRFLFDPKSGMFFSINEEAAWIINEMMAGKNRRQIEDGLVKERGTDPGTARRDVEHFWSNLGLFGMILPTADEI